MQRHVTLGLLLAGITLGLYWPVWHFGLIYYDDPLFLTECPEIQSGLNWHSFWWAFSSVVIANWHPVTTLSFVIDHQLFGTNPAAEHGVNVLFHTANVLLFYWLLHRLTGSPWRSALAAGLFAWHPLRVESVVWITERKDVLSGFFFLLTLLLYVRYVQERGSLGRKSALFYGLSLLAFALGLMSKAMLVTAPFVLLLLDFWPLRRWRPASATTPETPPSAGSPLPLPTTGGRAAAKLVLEKVPFFAITLLFSVLTYEIQKNYAAMVSLDQLGWSYRIANSVADYGRYLGKLFWPENLAIMYPYHRLDDWAETGMAAAVLAGVSLFCLVQWRRRPWLAVGWFWYLGTSIPIIGLVQVGESSMADRYTYLTLLGPVLALVWSIPDHWLRSAAGRAGVIGASAVALGALAVTTRGQVDYWRDTAKLFSHAVAVTGENASAEVGWGIGLEHEGRLPEALVHYQRAIALAPGDRDAYLKAGHVLMAENQWGKAADTMRALLAINPRDLLAHENLGVILPHLGRAPEARDQWETAVSQAPDETEALNNLAWLLATDPDPALRDGPRAVALAEHACTLTEYKQTIFIGTLAAAYAEAGRFGDAIATARKACANAAAHGETASLRLNQELLALYERHESYHEAAQKLVPGTQ